MKKMFREVSSLYGVYFVLAYSLIVLDFKSTAQNHPPVAPDCPVLAIPTEFIKANYKQPVLSGPTAVVGGVTVSRPGGAALYQNIGSVNVGSTNGTTSVAIDMKVTFVSTTGTNSNGHIDFTIGNTAATINDTRWRANGWSNGDVHTIKVEFFVSGTSTPASYSGVWNFSDIDSPTSTPERVYMPTNVVGDYLITSPSKVTVATVGTEYRFTGSDDSDGGYDPTFAFSTILESTQSFTMKLQNGGGSTTFFVNGNNFNYIPTAVCRSSDQYTIDEDNVVATPAVANLLANDKDLDGDVLTISAVQGLAANVGTPITLPSGATVTVNVNGTFSYDPRTAYDYLNNGQTATDQFYYQVSDGNGGFDLGTVTITITGITDISKTLQVQGSTVCSNVSTASVTILLAEAGVTYEAYKGSTLLASGLGNNTHLTLSLPVASLSLGSNTITFVGKRTGSSSVTLNNTAIVVVNKLPNAALTVVGSTVCQNGANATVTIMGTSVGETYQAYEGTQAKGAAVVSTSSGIVTLTLPLGTGATQLNPATIDHTLNVSASIAGCGTISLTDTALVKINKLPSSTLTVNGSIVCSDNTSATVTIVGTSAGESYQAFEGTQAKGNPVVSTGGNVVLTIQLGVGTAQLDPATLHHILNVRSSIAGCGVVNIADTALVKINKLPSAALTVNGSTVCSNSASTTVTIVGTSVGESYQAYVGTQAKGTPVISGGGNVILTLPLGTGATQLNPATLQHVLNVRSSIAGCGMVNIADTALVKINKLPSSALTVNGSTVCSKSASATVTIVGTSVGESYQAYVGTQAKGNPVISGGGNVTLSLPLGTGATQLNPATLQHVLSVRGSIVGCGMVNITDTALVKINKLPSGALAINGSTVCSSSPSAAVTIVGTLAGEVYQAFEGVQPKGNAVVSTGGNVVLTLPLGTASLQLDPVELEHTLHVTASIAGCGTITLSDTALVRINKLPSEALGVTGSTVCSNSTSATVTIVGTLAGEIYQAYEGTQAKGNAVASTGGNVVLILPLGTGLTQLNPTTLDHILHVRSSIVGCGTINLIDTALVKINKLPSGALTVTGSTICSNSPSATVTVVGTTAGETYQAYEGAQAKGSPVISTGGNVALVLFLGTGLTQLDPNTLEHVLRVQSSIAGCGTVNVLDTALVKINKLPSETLIVTGGTVCSNSHSATVTIVGTLAGESYQAYEGAQAKGNPVLSTGGNVILVLPLGTGSAQLDPSTVQHILRVQSSIPGCETISVADTAGVTIHPLPKDDLLVTGGVGCGNGADAKVTVTGTRVGEIYQAYKGATPVGVPVMSTGGNIILNIPVVSLGVGSHIIQVTASIAGCALVTLQDTALIVVNTVPNDNLSVTGSTVCSTDAAALVTVSGTNLGERYQAYTNNTAIGASVISNGGNVILSLPTSSLGIGSHVITIRSVISGCGEASLVDTALVVVNQLPNSALKVTGTTICSNTDSAKVVIAGTLKGERYQAYLGIVAIGPSQLSNGGVVTLSIPRNSLTLGLNIVQVSASIAGCGKIDVTDTAAVIVHPLPDETLLVTGSVVCSNSTEAIVTVQGTRAGETYQVLLGTRPIGNSIVSAGGVVTLSVPASDFTIGRNIVQVRASIVGCANVALIDTGLVVVNLLPKDNLKVTGSTLCSNSIEAEVNVEGTLVGEVYQAYLGTDEIGNSVVSNGGLVRLRLPRASLSIGLNTIHVSANIGGCAKVDLVDTAAVIVNPLPADSLRVTGSTVCSNSIEAILTIQNTKAGELYQALLGTSPIGSAVVSTGGVVTLRLPVGGLEIGNNVMKVTASIPGCATVTLADTGLVRVNPLPNDNLTLNGNIVCTTESETSVQIVGTRLGEKYVIFLGAFPLDTIVSTGGGISLQVPVANLNVGNNTISAQSSIEGCAIVDIADTATVVLNPLPANSLPIKGDTVCAGIDFAEVTIGNTKIGETYQGYESGNPIGASVLSKGGSLVLQIPVNGKLPSGSYKISVSSTIAGCATVFLQDSASILVSSEPANSLVIIGDTVCSNSSFAYVKIKGSKRAEVYTVLLNNVPISTPVTSQADSVLIEIPVSALALFLNQITVRISIPGCDDIFLRNAGNVFVNPLPSDSLSTEGDIVCETALNATVKVYNTQPRVAYQAIVGGIPAGLPVVGTGGTIELILPLASLQKGAINKVVVRTSLYECAQIDLKDTAEVTVNKVPDLGLAQVEGSSVCPGQDGRVIISKTEAGVTYQMYLNAKPISYHVTGTAAGTPDTLTIPSVLLDQNINLVTFTASIPACATVNVASQRPIYVLDGDNLDLNGDRLLCHFARGQYMINEIPGAVSYEWETENTAAILPFIDASHVTVQFDTLSAHVKVYPIGTFGTCRSEGDSVFVTIEAPLRGIGMLKAKDTVCVNNIDTLTVSPVTGAARYRWSWPADVQVLDSVASDSGRYKYIVRYLASGKKQIIALPYSECARTYGDTISKEVLVFSYPIAEANEYELTPFTGTIREMHLNGNGSSLNGTGTQDSLTYKWYADKNTPADIFNADKLNDATLVPKLEETKVFLTITQKYGYCPSKDSALIRIRFKIDIPNVFSPNNDGVHDQWEIKNITTFFPNAVVEIFNKWGSVVWKSAPGYPEPWNGTRNGEDLPVATYYYVLDVKDGGKPFVGSVTIIK